MKEYVGDILQVRGAEQYVLQGGKGDGMHFLCVRNGLGLEAWISLDRAGDISRLSVKGQNCGYFSPCGYVAPQYYDGADKGFLKSFTAGFFTTCGLTAVGSPCTDEGELLPLHGTVSHIPAILNGTNESETELCVKLTVKDAVIFGRKLVLTRVYRFSYTENLFTVSDTVTNEGDTRLPYMIMYHCNMGYPLLTENSTLKIPCNSITARDEIANKYIDSALIMEKPTACYEERCYYYDVKESGGVASVGIFNADIDLGLVMSFDKKTLPCFTEWKMMGKRDYVLGLEPGNCTPDGRDVMRKNGTLQFINPDESVKNELCFKFVDDKNKFDDILS